MEIFVISSLTQAYGCLVRTCSCQWAWLIFGWKPGVSDRNALLYLVGVGAHWSNEDKPAVALAEVPDSAPRFVMMHHPESFALFPANSAPIVVAGHTHGGQIRLPFTPEWSWLTFTKEDRVHADG